jgi:uridine kinase
MTTRSPERAAVLTSVATAIGRLPATTTRLVVVDGVDGAGKTHFADELGAELLRAGMPLIRASVDGFHHPREFRYRRGRWSPEGFFRDSYDYPALRRLLLDPLRSGRGGYVRQVYDVQAEQPVPVVTERAPPAAVLVFDGIFVHRDELAAYWDYSVYLDVPFAVSIPRGAQRGYGDADPAAPSNARYIQGQQIYLAECDPMNRATLVIDNSRLDRPTVLRCPRASSSDSWRDRSR